MSTLYSLVFICETRAAKAIIGLKLENKEKKLTKDLNHLTCVEISIPRGESTIWLAEIENTFNAKLNENSRQYIEFWYPELSQIPEDYVILGSILSGVDGLTELSLSLAHHASCPHLLRDSIYREIGIYIGEGFHDKIGNRYGMPAQMKFGNMVFETILTPPSSMYCLRQCIVSGVEGMYFSNSLLHRSEEEFSDQCIILPTFEEKLKVIQLQSESKSNSIDISLVDPFPIIKQLSQEFQKSNFSAIVEISTQHLDYSNINHPKTSEYFPHISQLLRHRISAYEKLEDFSLACLDLLKLNQIDILSNDELKKLKEYWTREFSWPIRDKVIPAKYLSGYGSFNCGGPELDEVLKFPHIHWITATYMSTPRFFKDLVLLVSVDDLEKAIADVPMIIIGQQEKWLTIEIIRHPSTFISDEITFREH